MEIVYNFNNEEITDREIWGKERNGFILNCFNKNDRLAKKFNKKLQEIADQHIENYRGGFWALFSLSNGGFYLTLTKRQYPSALGLKKEQGVKMETIHFCVH